MQNVLFSSYSDSWLLANIECILKFHHIMHLCDDFQDRRIILLSQNESIAG
jgi:hypothetical protein